LGNREDIQEKDKSLASDMGETKNELKEKAIDLLQNLRVPSRFSFRIYKELENLANQMVKLKLPTSTSSEFLIMFLLIFSVIFVPQIHSFEFDSSIKNSVRNMPKYKDLSSLKSNLTDLSKKYSKIKQERDALKMAFDNNKKKKIEELNNSQNF
jgi:hypothetical protein